MDPLLDCTHPTLFFPEYPIQSSLASTPSNKSRIVLYFQLSPNDKRIEFDLNMKRWIVYTSRPSTIRTAVENVSKRRAALIASTITSKLTMKMHQVDKNWESVM